MLISYFSATLSLKFYFAEAYAGISIAVFALCAAAIASSYFIFKKKFAPAASEKTLNVSDIDADLEAGQLKSVTVEAKKMEVSSTSRDPNNSKTSGQNSADDDSDAASLDSDDSNSESDGSKEDDTNTGNKSSPQESDSDNESKSEASETDSESDAELKAKVVSTDVFSLISSNTVFLIISVLATGCTQKAKSKDV